MNCVPRCTRSSALFGWGWIGRQRASDKLRRFLKNIVDAGERLLALVNDLLDILKLESGKMVYQFARSLWRWWKPRQNWEMAELIRRRDLQWPLPPSCTYRGGV